MSLRYLLPADGVTELLGSWPDEPRLYERETTELDRHVNEGFFETWAFSGCVPAAEVAVMNHGAKPPRPSINPAGFMTNGRTDGNKLRGYCEQGYTLRLGNLQRVVPFLNGVSRRIQRETGYSNYLHAFLTPPGGQGLRHHWDQQMAVIVQISGTKTWELWEPKFKDPMRLHLESPRVWQEHWREEWAAKGPDQTYELRPGQSLLLPRGWIHNPHARGAAESSVHLTFAIRERTPFWLAEKLTEGAIEGEEFRRIILPEQIQGDGLSGELEGARLALIRYLERLNPEELSSAIRDAALTELEYTT
ncbi:JmjC domain-containing protein [Streptomyces sp. NPDC059477]|uniref:JmjC domain-containing protein n=1 Tax=Streptomyces sp. NPDC059477 TaxID=3346847 RepID=UPI0036BC8F5A